MVWDSASALDSGADFVAGLVMALEPESGLGSGACLVEAWDSESALKLESQLESDASLHAA